MPDRKSWDEARSLSTANHLPTRRHHENGSEPRAKAASGRRTAFDLMTRVPERAWKDAYHFPCRMLRNPVGSPHCQGLGRPDRCRPLASVMSMPRPQSRSRPESHRDLPLPRPESRCGPGDDRHSGDRSSGVRATYEERVDPSWESALSIITELGEQGYAQSAAVVRIGRVAAIGQVPALQTPSTMCWRNSSS